MKINGYKIKALFVKDIKSLLRNPNAGFMLLMPIAFAVIYSFIMDGGMENAPYFIFILCTLLNFGVAPVSVVGMSIAEEKEKSTLRTLMLSNVSSAEFMISKLLVGFVLFAIVEVIIFFITGLNIANFAGYMITAFIVSIPALMFGAVVGLVSKDQMSTGYYGTPVMLLFMAPIFGMQSEAVNMFTKFIPTQSMITLQYVESFSDLVSGKGLFAIAVILAWIVISAVIFRFVYKKNSLDN